MGLNQNPASKLLFLKLCGRFDPKQILSCKILLFMPPGKIMNLQRIIKSQICFKMKQKYFNSEVLMGCLLGSVVQESSVPHSFPQGKHPDQITSPISPFGEERWASWHGCNASCGRESLGEPGSEWRMGAQDLQTITPKIQQQYFKIKIFEVLSYNFWFQDFLCLGKKWKLSSFHQKLYEKSVELKIQFSG